ncbi:hypothetical protein [Natronorubrum sp. FCH18a]
MARDADPLRELAGLVDESEFENRRRRSAEFRADASGRFGVLERADRDR